MDKQIPNIWVNRAAISPVIGLIMMLLLTILLAGITVSAVYGEDISSSLTGAPMASIEVEYVEGGMPHPIRFDQNFLYIVHRGGNPLSASSTKIVITGQGSAHTSNFIVGMDLYGDVVISYDNLLFDGKDPAYATRNSVLSDGVWSTGEELVLNGYDSVNGGPSSTVSVSINSFSNTSNNYGLKKNGLITIKILDSETQRLISECKCTVVPAE